MDIDALYFRNSQEWRRWLEENADHSQEVWLVQFKKNSDKASISIGDAVGEALCFGWVDGKLKNIDEERFILRYCPRKTNSIWSKINKERAEKLISAGKMTPFGLAKIEEAKKNGYWDAAYTNKTKDKIPSDLQIALTKDPKALSNFQSFANSYQNMYIAWITGAKTKETREKRIAEVVKRSALNKKPGIV